MTKQEAIKTCESRFMNRYDWTVKSSATVSQIIEHYENLLKGEKPIVKKSTDNIEKCFIEAEIQELENEEDNYYCGHYDDLPF